MPKRTNEFQKLVYLVKQQLADDSTTVTESKLLCDRHTETEREIDICIERIIAGHLVTVCFECRDRSRKADVGWVEEMKGKHEDLPTDHLVLVSRNGFTAEAVNKAHLWGIETLALKDITAETVHKLWGGIEQTWLKTLRLAPTKVLVDVSATDGYPSEKVLVEPSHAVYSDDGNLVGAVKDILDRLLTSGTTLNPLLVQGEELHKGFHLRIAPIKLTDGKSVCLKKLEPEMLRPIDSIEILGACTFLVNSFKLEHGQLGPVTVAWGTSPINDKKGMLVATENSDGSKLVTIDPSPLEMLEKLS